VLDAGTIVETLPVAEIGEARHAATLALLKALPVPPDVLLTYRDRSVVDVLAPSLSAC
jgi:ABC-type dipeptide/oligopeptide/nickel transport system ATPase component